MKLSDLLIYDPITIQCHDNPDADALASGYGLYSYFKDKNRNVRFIYSGNYVIQKSNLKLMVEQLNIPIQYKKDASQKLDGLLLLVDCQYGESNVARIEADTIAVIDHHQIEMRENELCEIRPTLGSCSTLVWKMLCEEGYSIKDNPILGTALYYGLYTDTNQFAEIYNPLDMDMMEGIPVNKALITRFRNANISINELETAGIALIRNIFNDKHRYAIIKAQPCDPNVLGMISDFLLQVDKVDTCVVYNDLHDGFKLSVRSCIKEVRANELAEYLCEGIGSGGGHLEKAGGFISRKLYNEQYPGIHSESYFGDKLNHYFENTQIIYAAKQHIDRSEMKKYLKKNLEVGFVKADEVYPAGTGITIRTLDGDVALSVTPDLIIMIGIRGEVYPINYEVFSDSYKVLEGKYDPHRSVVRAEYIPMIKSTKDGSSRLITEFAERCIPTKETIVYAKKIKKITKIFTVWDEDKYLLGNPGDYLAVSSSDPSDIYIVEKNIFQKTYSPL